MSSSSSKILFYLKQHGASALQQIADALGVTTMGARGHLHKLEQQQLLEFNDISKGPGRPTRHWQLTASGHAHFGDRHQDFNLQLLDAIDSLFGEQGLTQLIEHRSQKQQQHYQQALADCHGIEQKLQVLAQLRQQEGYMARIETTAEGYVLIEDHCPICAAASRCQGLCQQELELFQGLLIDEATVKRSEHLLASGRRCAYLVTVK
ncbi:metalloregulator ArsR/SmtB family transcription factor [uncultured Ferrimonas sp.]|uniref:helix-turn-helix transcriptional regulator n=1 Tax=uncultured Ferrimonas sp. TaxID=432640 RepID=UPI00261E0CDB|nr:metalloregulator ArsR/SmtB family transcription factor [uncultured Ferrimonas sp.]